MADSGRVDSRIKEVLIIDDEPSTRNLVRRILESSGYRVFVADSVATGMKVAERRVPHLIISDLNLPQASGYTFLEKKRRTKQLAAVPVLALSRRSDQKSIYRAMSLGAVDYIAKPFAANVLLSKVQKALRSFGSKKVSLLGKKARATVDSKIVRASDVGFVLSSPIRIAPRTEVSIQSNLLEELECQDGVFRTTATPGETIDGGIYQNDILIAGLSSRVTQVIRKKIREW